MAMTKIRRLIITALLLVLTAVPALAQAPPPNLPPPGGYQSVPNYTGALAGQQFRNAINDRFSGVTATSPKIVSFTFANLPAEQDGLLIYCADCQKTAPCTAGGSGAWAFGQRGQWMCSVPALEGPLNANGQKLTGLGAAAAPGDALSWGQSGAKLGLNNVLNVMAAPYYATGNGTTDDSGALNSALAAAVNQRVHLPAGTYLVSAAGLTIPSGNLTLEGDGVGVTTVKMANGANLAALLTSASQSNLTIRGITFDCNRANNTTVADGVSLTGGADITVQDAEVNNCAGFGIHVINPTARIRIDHNKLADDGLNGLSSGKPIRLEASNAFEDFRIERNHIDDTVQGAGCIKVMALVAPTPLAVDGYVQDNVCLMTDNANGPLWGIELFAQNTNGLSRMLVKGNRIIGPATPSVNVFGISNAGNTAAWQIVDNLVQDCNARISIETIIPNTIISGNLIIRSGPLTVNSFIMNVAVTGTVTGAPTLTITVSTAGQLIVGEYIKVLGAGPGGMNDIYRITAISGTTFTVDHDFQTNVTNATVLASDYGGVVSHNTFIQGTGTGGDILLTSGGGTNGSVDGWLITGNEHLFPGDQAVNMQGSVGAAVEFNKIEGELIVGDKAVASSAFSISVGNNNEFANNTIYNDLATPINVVAGSANNEFFMNRCYNCPSMVLNDHGTGTIFVNSEPGGGINLPVAPAALGDVLGEGRPIGAIAPIPSLQLDQLISTPYTLTESGGGTVTPDLSKSLIQIILVSDTSAWTLGNPLNMNPGGGQVWWLDVINNQAGTPGAVTLGSDYRHDSSFGVAATQFKRRICPVINDGPTDVVIGACSADE